MCNSKKSDGKPYSVAPGFPLSCSLLSKSAHIPPGEPSRPLSSTISAALLTLGSVILSKRPSGEGPGPTPLTPDKASSPPWPSSRGDPFPSAFLSNTSLLWLAKHRPYWPCPVFYGLSSTYLLSYPKLQRGPSQHMLSWTRIQASSLPLSI